MGWQSQSPPRGTEGSDQALSCTLSYVCFRLLGASLPMLSKEQLQLVMRGDTIRHYGEHVVTAKVGATPAAHTARNSQASC